LRSLPSEKEGKEKKGGGEGKKGRFGNGPTVEGGREGFHPSTTGSGTFEAKTYTPGKKKKKKSSRLEGGGGVFKKKKRERGETRVLGKGWDATTL